MGKIIKWGDSRLNGWTNKGVSDRCPTVQQVFNGKPTNNTIKVTVGDNIVLDSVTDDYKFRLINNIDVNLGGYKLTVVPTFGYEIGSAESCAKTISFGGKTYPIDESKKAEFIIENVAAGTVLTDIITFEMYDGVVFDGFSLHGYDYDGISETPDTYITRMPNNDVTVYVMYTYESFIVYYFWPDSTGYIDGSQRINTISSMMYPSVNGLVFNNFDSILNDPKYTTTELKKLTRFSNENDNAEFKGWGFATGTDFESFYDTNDGIFYVSNNLTFLDAYTLPDIKQLNKPLIAFHGNKSAATDTCIFVFPVISMNRKQYSSQQNWPAADKGKYPTDFVSHYFNSSLDSEKTNNLDYISRMIDNSHLTILNNYGFSGPLCFFIIDATYNNSTAAWSSNMEIRMACPIQYKENASCSFSQSNFSIYDNDFSYTYNIAYTASLDDSDVKLFSNIGANSYINLQIQITCKNNNTMASWDLGSAINYPSPFAKTFSAYFENSTHSDAANMSFINALIYENVKYTYSRNENSVLSPLELRRNMGTNGQSFTDWILQQP